LLGFGAPVSVLAQDANLRVGRSFPTKPVRLVLPYPAGGGSDAISRLLAQRLTDIFGQPVVIDNRGGGGGAIGMEIAARATPDGHTILMALTAQLAVNVSLYRALPYDPVKDFAPVTLLGDGPYLLVLHPSVPAKSVRELVALARERPDRLVFASSGTGSGGHLAGELLMSLTGARLLHVPYKGGGPALIDLLSGQAQVLFAPYASASGHVRSGRIRALAVSTARRPAALPDLPTIAESGVPGYDSGVWYGVLAPAATPPAIVTELHRAIVGALGQPDFRKVLVDAAIDPIGSTPAELGAHIRREIAKWAALIRASGIRVE
jgi:tripartite-type tricarboxylate transporter receptor subunit TctC